MAATQMRQLVRAAPRTGSRDSAIYDLAGTDLTLLKHDGGWQWKAKLLRPTTSETNAWLDKHRLHDQPFRTMKDARAVVEAIWHIEPPPSRSWPIDSPDAKLRRIGKGIYETADGTWRVELDNKAGRRRFWLIFRSDSLGDRQLGVADYLYCAQDLIFAYCASPIEY